MLQGPNSPLFPVLQLTLSPAISNSVAAANGVSEEHPLLLPQLPDKPLAQTSSVQVYIIPTEKNLFVQGFEAYEYAERPPVLLRGCLYLKVLKPSKIKSITLNFKGQQRTDWPEGIPPKKNTYAEINDILSHTWPFYQVESPLPNCGADFFKPLNSHTNDQDVSHLSLSDTITRSHSPAPLSTSQSHTSISTAMNNDNISLNNSNGGMGVGNFFTRNLSPATNFMKRAASPSVHSNDVPNDLTSSITNPDNDSLKPGHFPAGDYIYNFEHAIHPSIAETTDVTFGSVSYHLEANISRIGTFKLNLTARLPIDIIRTPSESNTEEHEPIVITRDWEDQLRYDIVVGGKSVILDSYLPLAFRFVPLWGKVALHRIRVYLTENLEYYCQNKKVHRMEPPKKYLLLEHKAKKGRSLLSKSGGLNEEAPPDEEDDILPRELEFQLFVPKTLSDKHCHNIHPDTSFENIQAHHWIKICLRISKLDPENEGKRKHYEILIDSPIHVLSEYAAHGNTLLPAYDTHQRDEEQFLPKYTPSSPPLSPGVVPINTNNILASALNNNSGTQENSLDHIMESPIRPSTPLEFHHINSVRNNDEPIERDPDMHLGANLYKPSEDSALNSQMHSPQAFPHPSTFTSPINSPIQRPIHILRQPSYNPPPFNADNAPPTIDDVIPPPAYEEEDHSLSMSPLRINDDTITTPPRAELNVIPPTPVNVIPPTPQETPIKERLEQQLEEATKNNIANQTSASGSNKSSQKTLKRPLVDDEDGEDLVDFGDAPIQAPLSPQPLHLLINRSRRNSSNKGSNHASRRSSISSLGSSENLENMPVEQTMPLLNLSASSINVSFSAPSLNERGRNDSIHSLLQDSTRRPSNINDWSTRKMDLMSNDLTDDVHGVNGKLSKLRNPRIKRHYNDSVEEDTISSDSMKPKIIEEDMAHENIEMNELASNGETNSGTQPSSRSSTSFESEITIDESTGLRRKNDSKDHHQNNSNNQVPGLNYGYTIE